MPSTIATTWDSTTTANTTLLLSASGSAGMQVNLVVSGSLTSGQLNFEVSDDGINFFPVIGIVQSTFSIFSNWQPSFGSPVAFQINVNGFNYFQIRVQTALVGTGSVAVGISNAQAPVIVVVAGVQQNGANLHMTLDDSTGANTATVTAGKALKVDGSAVTQPISGAVTVSGTVSTSDGNVITQGSATSGQKGFLELGAVTTAAPAYTTAQSSPFSLTTAGGLRTDQSSWGGTALGTPTNFGTTPGAVVSGSVNASLFVGTTVAVASSAGVQKVGIAGGVAGASIDGAINGAAPTNAVSTQVAPSTAAAYALATPGLAASLTVLNIKASAGNVYGCTVVNKTAGVIYLQFYNTAGVPTLGTGVVYWIPIAASATLVIQPGSFALANHTTGIGIGASTTPTSTGTPGTAPDVTVWFK